MKTEIRKEILEKRNRLGDKEIRSKIIKEKLFNLSEYKNAGTIMFYVSFGSEVDTIEMIKESLKNKTVCVPVVKDNKIIPSLIHDIKELNRKSRYGILEPSVVKEIDKRKIELVIVPGIAFDKKGHRIGYGKGYYDDFLKDFKAKTVGLAFKTQVIETIPNDEWDIQLGKLISEV